MGSIPTRSRHPGPAAARLAGLATLAAAILAAAAPAPAGAQQADTARAGPPPEGIPAEPDTAGGPPVSPLGALGRSIVLPGWGQAEVDQPLRGGVYFAAQAASLWMVFKSQAKLSSARRGTVDEDGRPGQDPPLVESRSSQRENWIVLSAFIALMSGVDAWASAHLWDFEGELEPPEDGTAGVQLEYRVPLTLE